MVVTLVNRNNNQQYIKNMDSIPLVGDYIYVDENVTLKVLIIIHDVTSSHNIMVVCTKTAFPLAVNL